MLKDGEEEVDLRINGLGVDMRAMTDRGDWKKKTC
jgi:hypothetical protein